MELVIRNYSITYLVAILIGSSGAWMILIKSMLKSFKETPYLDKFECKGT